MEEISERIIDTLALSHLDQSRIHYYRSTGSKAHLVAARIHGLGKIWFDALSMKPHYIIEVISEQYDKLDQSDREKVVIHELMHIPSRFSGGFVPHKGKVTRKNVDQMHLEYTMKKLANS